MASAIFPAGPSPLPPSSPLWESRARSRLQPIGTTTRVKVSGFGHVALFYQLVWVRGVRGSATQRLLGLAVILLTVLLRSVSERRLEPFPFLLPFQEPEPCFLYLSPVSRTWGFDIRLLASEVSWFFEWGELFFYGFFMCFLLDWNAKFGFFEAKYDCLMAWGWFSSWIICVVSLDRFLLSFSVCFLFSDLMRCVSGLWCWSRFVIVFLFVFLVSDAVLAIRLWFFFHFKIRFFEGMAIKFINLMEFLTYIVNRSRVDAYRVFYPKRFR